MAKSLKKRKNEWMFRQYVDDSFKYIAESRNYIYFVMLIFLVFLFLGFVFIPKNPELSNLVNQTLKNIVLRTAGLSGVNLILFIFINNLAVSFFCMFSGVVFGIYPVLVSVVNGSVLGYVFSKVLDVAGPLNLLAILPHGIFELPAVFISFGLGVKLGTFFISKNPKNEFVRRLVGSIKVFFFVIMPLLILAAIIEGLLITFVK
jgi:stage II sporulation protein M